MNYCVQATHGCMKALPRPFVKRIATFISLSVSAMAWNLLRPASDASEMIFSSLHGIGRHQIVQLNIEFLLRSQ